MSASNGGLTGNGQQRELMIQAAVAYDETQKRITSLEDQLNRAVAALEAKNGEIENLTLLLSQERNRNDSHRNERDPGRRRARRSHRHSRQCARHVGEGRNPYAPSPQS
jgi:chromosome segregation ATPase